MRHLAHRLLIAALLFFGCSDATSDAPSDAGRSVDARADATDTAPGEDADGDAATAPDVSDADIDLATPDAVDVTDDDAASETDGSGADTIDDASGDTASDISGDIDADVDGGDIGEDGTPPPRTGPVRTIVVAGDSWSNGLVSPTRDALDARGFPDVALRWETTANAGSQANGWVDNLHPPAAGGGRDTAKPRMMDALMAALDADPPADMLLLSIGGNDLNAVIGEGWGEWAGFRQDLAMDTIEDDVETIIERALEGRSGLRVAIVGYSYFHFEFLRAFGLSMDGFDTTSYNEAFIELDRRRMAVASRHEGVVYAHNFGILQHTYGDTIHPPFSIPNPLTGYPAYEAGVAPAPGGPPDYAPYPGGFYTYPAPLDAIPDGIHPSPAGFRVIIEHTLDQLPAGWFAGE